ncbi:hypothetical protein FQZ97_592760 [compost metagenome]
MRIAGVVEAIPVWPSTVQAAGRNPVDPLGMVLVFRGVAIRFVQKHPVSSGRDPAGAVVYVGQVVQLIHGLALQSVGGRAQARGFDELQAQRCALQQLASTNLRIEVRAHLQVILALQEEAFEVAGAVDLVALQEFGQGAREFDSDRFKAGLARLGAGVPPVG